MYLCCNLLSHAPNTVDSEFYADDICRKPMLLLLFLTAMQMPRGAMSKVYQRLILG